MSYPEHSEMQWNFEQFALIKWKRSRFTEKKTTLKSHPKWLVFGDILIRTPHELLSGLGSGEIVCLLPVLGSYLLVPWIQHSSVLQFNWTVVLSVAKRTLALLQHFVILLKKNSVLFTAITPPPPPPIKIMKNDFVQKLIVFYWFDKCFVFKASKRNI